ncbi:uncharacterized protein LOC143280453 isoform X2 [Babylonia areolata]|uniref:uncharacterized protein LOC143280453 isoform X2 n=1 Tax=Babylonia areolata TaxID=304850 RepID=UPI003FD23C99
MLICQHCLLVSLRTALDVRGELQVRLHQQENGTWEGTIEDPRLGDKDDIGALYYVIAVIFIYGLSIVMMIASHIRKNKQDCQLRAYLKEMALLRKADRRDKLLDRINSLAAAAKVRNALKTGGGEGAKGLFRLGSKSSFKLGSKRNSVKEPSVDSVFISAGADPEVPKVLDPGQTLMMTNISEDPTRQDDGNETTDSADYLDLPVDFTLDMNRLSPCGNVTPITSASATPSPPPKHIQRTKTKISFEDEAFIL